MGEKTHWNGAISAGSKGCAHLILMCGGTRVQRVEKACIGYAVESKFDFS